MNAAMMPKTTNRVISLFWKNFLVCFTAVFGRVPVHLCW